MPENDDYNLKIIADKLNSEISVYQIFNPTHLFICDNNFGQVSSWHSLHQFSSAGGKHWIKLYLIYRTWDNIVEIMNLASDILLSTVTSHMMQQDKVHKHISKRDP